ncbi:MAG: hypothetical protein J0H39_12050 [Alphaproteobacteria bacterium]|nr:hypothetical protein [Alphaproteobacteria bacterium]
MGLDVALNLVLAVLLAAVIVYAWRLHKRLGTWRDGKAELDRTIKEFNEAAKRAEAAVADLKNAGEAAGRLLEDQTRKAISLKDDLEYIVSRAEPVADRAAENVRERERERERERPQVARRAERAERYEREERYARDERYEREAPPAPVSDEEDRLLRDAIRFAEREGGARENNDRPAAPRSTAEQELLKAIAERRRGAPPATRAGAR